MNVREALDNIYKEFEKTYEEAKKEGYEEADSNQKENAIYAYERGLDDAWECARKISQEEPFGLTTGELEQIFNTRSIGTVIEKNTASEAISKIKEYEEKQKQTDDEIKVGDEVYIDDKGRKAVVSRVLDNGLYNIVFYNGDTNCVDRCFIAKSGRHFPCIEEVLNQMQEEW